MIQDRILQVMFVLFLALLVAVILVPFAFSYGTFLHLDGSPSVIDHDWSQYGVGGWIYSLGDLICHQEQSRSFILNGSQMPICMRDVGLLIGFVIGLFACMHLKENIRERRYLMNGALMLLLTFMEWSLEALLSIDLPVSRFILGIVSGIGAALIIGYALRKTE